MARLAGQARENTARGDRAAPSAPRRIARGGAGRKGGRRRSFAPVERKGEGFPPRALSARARRRRRGARGWPLGWSRRGNVARVGGTITCTLPLSLHPLRCSLHPLRRTHVRTAAMRGTVARVRGWHLSPPRREEPPPPYPQTHGPDLRRERRVELEWKVDEPGRGKPAGLTGGRWCHERFVYAGCPLSTGRGSVTKAHAAAPLAGFGHMSSCRGAQQRPPGMGMIQNITDTARRHGRGDETAARASFAAEHHHRRAPSRRPRRRASPNGPSGRAAGGAAHARRAARRRRRAHRRRRAGLSPGRAAARRCAGRGRSR